MMLLRRFLPPVAVLLLGIGLLAVLAPETRALPRYIALLCRRAPDALPVPVRGVRPSQLADTWGAPRSGGRRHEGIDIFARRNTPVLSATDGVISERGIDGLGGRYVMVIGSGGYRHYYAHLERWGAPGIGDWVRAGDLIGYVGDSGNAKGTPTHLHYGIYTFIGGAIDPFPFLASGRGLHQ
ncbi:MAG: peptidase [Chlorobi bacterium]|nr:peptidase [Chlorobiota bacterium]